MVSVEYKFGDCRKLIQNIDDEKIRMVVTSPPYNLNKKTGLGINLCKKIIKGNE